MRMNELDGKNTFLRLLSQYVVLEEAVSQQIAFTFDTIRETGINASNVLLGVFFPYGRSWIFATMKAVEWLV